MMERKRINKFARIVDGNLGNLNSIVLLLNDGSLA